MGRPAVDEELSIARTIRFPTGLRDKIVADAERCGRSFEGQVIAQVGNNGRSHHPHIHVGAYKDTEPLQIRFDQHYIQ